MDRDGAAGISLAVVNNDKKWNKFVKSLQSNLELLGGGGGAHPDVADIFGVDNPQFANILKSIGTLEKDIEQMKSSPSTTTVKKNKKKSTMKHNNNVNNNHKKKKKNEENKKQTYKSTTAAL